VATWASTLMREGAISKTFSFTRPRTYVRNSDRSLSGAENFFESHDGQPR